MPNLEHQAVWAGKEVKCFATLEGRDYQGASVKFVFTKSGNPDDGKKLGEVDARVSGGQASAKWTPPEPEGDALSYVAKYHLEVTPANGPKKEEKNQVQDLIVFTKKITVTAKTGDGKKCDDGVCRMTQVYQRKTHVVEKRTDSEGKIVFDLKYPAGVLLDWLRPRILENGVWVKGDGRAREAKLLFKPELKILNYAQPDKSKKLVQWVNLKADPEELDRGHTVTIEVGGKVPGEAPANLKVYLKASYHADNSKRTNVGGGAPGTEKKQEGNLDIRTRTVSFQVELGHAGKDVIKIEVGSTPDCKDDVITFETWRKLYYEILAPQHMTEDGTLQKAKFADDTKGWDLHKDTRDWVKARLDKVGVVYECVKSQIFSPADTHDEFYYEAKYLKQSGKKKLLVLGGDYMQQAHDPKPFSAVTEVAGGGTTDMLTVHTRLCDRSVRPKPLESYTTNGTTSPHMVAKTKKFTLAKYVYKVNFETDADSITNYNWVAVIDDAALIAAGHTPADHPGKAYTTAWQALPRDCVVHLDENNIEIKLKGLPATLAGALDATHCPIRVRFTAAVNGGINGSAGSGRQIMVMRRPKKAVACTICHELAHSMGQTVFGKPGNRQKVTPLGMPMPKDVQDVPMGDYYDDTHGHAGSHCSKGVDKSGPGPLSMLGKGGTCVMFGEGGDEEEPRRADYCEQCQTYIKARKLNYIRKAWSPDNGRSPDDY